jgi:hypothetical protein
MGYELKYKNKTIILPDFKDIPVGLIRKSRYEDPQTQMFTLLEGWVSEEDLAVLDTIPAGEFGVKMAEWTGGASLGES